MLETAAIELTGGYLTAEEDAAGRAGTTCTPRTVIEVTLAEVAGEDGEDDEDVVVFGVDEEEADLGEVVAGD